jgi:signal transduction histidine kinase
MRGRSLFTGVLIALLGVTGVSVLVTGLVSRSTVEQAFGRYLRGEPGVRVPLTGPAVRFGQMVLGAAERDFLASMDRAILLAVVFAIAVAAVAAVLLARYLTRPLNRLTKAAETLASGDLAHRVEVAGPAEVEELGRAFNDMATSLSEAELLRRRLVGDVAHELRTPIASLRAQAEGMAEGVLAVDDARLNSVVEDTVQLSILVDQLQELSVAEAGRLEYSVDEFDLAVVVAREVERARDAARDGVEVDSACGEGTMVSADGERVAQVVRNLLSNAVRHTDSGSIAVACAPAEGGVEIIVSDTGEGIPDEDLPYVFERFYRADAARARETGGAGIGLALARRIVEDHGGRMWLDSERGEGTRAGFFLPSEAEPGAARVRAARGA